MPGLGLFDEGIDESKFSLLQDPRQYSNPTGRSDPSVAPGAPAPAQPQGPGFTDILQAIGKGGLVGMASARDPLALFKVQNMEAESKRKDQAMDLEKVKMIPNVLAIAQHIQENIPQEGQAEAIKNLAPLIQKVYPGVNEQSLQALVGGGAGKVADFVKALPGAEKLFSQQELPKMATQFLKDPTKFRTEMSTRASQQAVNILHSGKPVPQEIQDAILNPADKKGFDEQHAAYGVGQLTQTLLDASIPDETKAKLKDMSRAQLTQLAPGLKNATDDQLTQLADAGYGKVKTKGMIEGADKDQATQQRFEANQAMQEKRMQQADEHFQQSQTRLVESMNRSDARAAASEARLQRRLDLTEEQQKRLTPQQVGKVTADKTAIATINDYEAAYNDFVKENKGVASTVLKASLAKNQGAQTIAEVTGIDGSTPAEKKLSAKYTALVGSLKSLTNEVGVLTDQDALRILG
jgi:hypothetical protein